MSIFLFSNFKFGCLIFFTSFLNSFIFPNINKYAYILLSLFIFSPLGFSVFITKFSMSIPILLVCIAITIINTIVIITKIKKKNNIITSLELYSSLLF